MANQVIKLRKGSFLSRLSAHPLAEPFPTAARPFPGSRSPSQLEERNASQQVETHESNPRARTGCLDIAFPEPRPENIAIGPTEKFRRGILDCWQRMWRGSPGCWRSRPAPFMSQWVLQGGEGGKRRGAGGWLRPDLDSFSLFNISELPVKPQLCRLMPGATHAPGRAHSLPASGSAASPEPQSEFPPARCEMGWDGNSSASSVLFVTPPTQCFLSRSGNTIVVAISEMSLPRSGSAEGCRSVTRGGKVVWELFWGWGSYLHEFGIILCPFQGSD